jgi:hypothetical protein
MCVRAYLHICGYIASVSSLIPSTPPLLEALEVGRPLIVLQAFSFQSPRLSPGATTRQMRAINGLSMGRRMYAIFFVMRETMWKNKSDSFLDCSHVDLIDLSYLCSEFIMRKLKIKCDWEMFLWLIIYHGHG